ncbi:MAG: dimethylarginine dimethylaminohydrolase family protein [Balneolaceae bacterium]
MKLTHHSEYGVLTSIYLKPAKLGFISQKVISEQWEELNYLGMPHYETALTEYAAFKQLIEATGASIKAFEMDESLTMDSIYCRDASIATDFGVILCAMGKDSRKKEPDAAKKIYTKNEDRILGRIEAPGTIEGGDLAWLDDKTLAVGRTYRTNDSGIEQLSALLQPHGIEVLKVDLPHYKGASDVFHLMSILSPLDKDLAVVYSPLMPISFRELLIERGFALIEVPDEEFESMGCNVLALSPRNCLMVAGNPITESRIRKAGGKVTTYSGTEISVKGGGGPTCLTRPMLRAI